MTVGSVVYYDNIRHLHTNWRNCHVRGGVIFVSIPQLEGMAKMKNGISSAPTKIEIEGKNHTVRFFYTGLHSIRYKGEDFIYWYYAPESEKGPGAEYRLLVHGNFHNFIPTKEEAKEIGFPNYMARN